VARKDGRWKMEERMCMRRGEEMCREEKRVMHAWSMEHGA